MRKNLVNLIWKFSTTNEFENKSKLFDKWLRIFFFVIAYIFISKINVRVFFFPGDNVSCGDKRVIFNASNLKILNFSLDWD